MADGKFKLLSAHQLAPAIRKALARAGTGVIAVPFWGKGAVSLLGLGRGAKVRVICNLDHPGCNPDVIAELRKHRIDVRSHRRLHAKIYATADRAFVGSSNASSNGLTVEGREAQGWLELNVASSDPKFVTDVLGEFEKLWDLDETLPVRALEIKRARERRAALPPIGPFLPDGQPLFDAIRANPKLFADVYLAIYDDRLSPEARGVLCGVQKGTVVAKGGRSVAAGVSPRSLKSAWGYQYRVMPRRAWLIDVACYTGKPIKYNGTAESTGLQLAVPPDADGDPQYDLTPALRGPIVLGGRKLRPNAAEQALVIRHAKALLEAAGDEVLPVSAMLRIIGES